MEAATQAEEVLLSSNGKSKLAKKKKKTIPSRKKSLQEYTVH